MTVRSAVAEASPPDGTGLNLPTAPVSSGLLQAAIQAGDLDHFSPDDVLAVFQMAKVGMSRGKWAPSRTLVFAYKRVREQLQNLGKLPK